jgi:hypothetical protein
MDKVSPIKKAPEGDPVLVHGLSEANLSLARRLYPGMPRDSNMASASASRPRAREASAAAPRPSNISACQYRAMGWATR